MNIIEKFLQVTGARFENTPTLYSPFHLVFIAIMIGLSVWMCVSYRNTTDKKFRTILFGYWIIMFLFEIYKNLEFSCSVDGISAVWSYPWYIFPFQFCSMPLYVLPLIIFLKDCKVRECAMAFIGTYALFAGLAVFAYPSTILIPIISITCQSLIHHGFQIVTGIFVLSYCRKRIDHWFLLKGAILFAVLSSLAIVIDVVFHAIKPDAYFDMFYISPYFQSSLPILSMIDPLVPYPVFLVIYLLGFTLCAAIVLYSTKGIYALITK
ncbi:MAG: YwaF family protein [Bacilli bacterium]|nr:YwaF family protein [Bacilli bacterium]